MKINFFPVGKLLGHKNSTRFRGQMSEKLRFQLYFSMFPTFYSEKNNHITHKNSFRLRGMATEEKYRKKGFGKLLLKTAEKIISEKGSNNLWCNARIIAVPFYLSCGYKISGQLFDIQDIGPHYMMYKNI